MATLLSGFLYTGARACDVCGGGTGNYNPFLFPHLSKSYIGLNYMHRSFHTHNDDGTKTSSHYSTLLLSGQYSLTRKLQLMAFIPYQFSTLENAGSLQKKSGLSDVSLLVNYRLWDKTGIVSHALIVSGGMEWGTGKYEAPKTQEITDRNFQLGSGSTDYLLNGTYRVSYRNWIVSAIGSYKYNTANKEGYRYGDVLTLGAVAAYRKNWDKISLAPYVQVIQENQMKDADRHILQEHSGGKILYAGAGADVSTSRFTIGANYQFATQNLAAGELNANPRLSTRISFTF